MKIVKLENGNVLLKDVGNVVKRFPENAVLELSQEGEAVRVAYGHQNKHDIYAVTITHTQIEPNAEVAFSGNAQNLLNLLASSFFFEVSVESTQFRYTASLPQDFKIQRQLNVSSISPNVLQTQKIQVESSVELASATLEVTTVGTAGSKATLGIYSLDEDGEPGQLISQTPSEFLLDSATVQTIAFSSPVSLDAGHYALAIIRSGTGGAIRISNFTNPWWGFSGLTSYSTGTVGLAYTSTLPTTHPTVTYTTGVVPFILFNLS